MTNTAATQWVPGADGSMILQAGSTTILSVTSAGVVSYTSSTSVGAMRVPAMTGAQRDALTPVTGMLIYNTTTNKLNFYAAAAWEAVTSA